MVDHQKMKSLIAILVVGLAAVACVVFIANLAQQYPSEVAPKGNDLSDQRLDDVSAWREFDGEVKQDYNPGFEKRDSPELDCGALPETCDVIDFYTDVIDGTTAIDEQLECIYDVIDRIIELQEATDVLQQGLEDLSNDMSPIETILGVLKNLPYVGSVFNVGKTAVQTLQHAIQNAEKVVDKINKGLDPVATAGGLLQDFREILDIIKAQTIDVLEDAKSGALNIATQCPVLIGPMEIVMRLVPTDQTVIDQLNNAESALEPVCSGFNTAWGLLNGISGTVKSINNALKPVIKAVDGTLGKVLNELNKLFDKKFCYKIKTPFGNDKVCKKLKKIMDLGKLGKIEKEFLKVVDQILSAAGVNKNWLELKWLTIPGLSGLSFPNGLNLDFSIPNLNGLNLPVFMIDWNEDVGICEAIATNVKAT